MLCAFQNCTEKIANFSRGANFLGDPFRAADASETVWSPTPVLYEVRTNGGEQWIELGAAKARCHVPRDRVRELITAGRGTCDDDGVDLEERAAFIRGSG